jgi:3-hydroxyisobutyrate dehydrogenase-like beta-hydroxyacid dehydrogenase
MKPTIGFIGLGVIGKPMAQRLLESGLSLVVWNRTTAKVQGLVASGARVAGSPCELAEACDVVITMLTDGPAVEEVAFGSDGIAAGLAAGKVHCDMSTIDPATTRRLAERYAGREIGFLHAPVLGNWRAAASGTLLIFAGGPRQAFEKCQPIFAALGSRTWRWDQAEQATDTKLACNLLLAGMLELFSESLVFAAKAGVEGKTFLEIICASALAAPMFQAKGELILQRNFTPSFYLRNMQKDLDLALDAGRRMGAALPATAAVRNVFAAAAQHGKAEMDYSAVFQWLEEQSAAGAAAS